MQLTITISPAQVAALTRSNDATNANRETPFTIEQFASDVVTERFNQFVQTWAERDAASQLAEIQAGMKALSPERVEAIRQEVAAALAAQQPEVTE